MKRDFSRTDRVSQTMQKELAMIIQREIKDPRVGMATISSVEVSRDLSYAKVFITLYNEDSQKSELAVSVLNDASGFIRSLLGKRIRARIMPHLRFVLDSTLMDGMRISNLVDQVIAKDKQKQKLADPSLTDEDQYDEDDQDFDAQDDEQENDDQDDDDHSNKTDKED